MDFFGRLGVLLLLMAVVAGLEACRRGRRATRWHEYGALLVGAAIAAGTGALIDVVTSTISPAYFTLGKAIEPGPGFEVRVAALGCEAGFSLGILAVALVFLARGDAEPSTPRRSLCLLRRTLFVLAPTLGTATIAGAVAGVFASSAWPFDLRDLLSPTEAHAFNTVWFTHCGVYAGALIGIVAVCRHARLTVQAG